MACLRSFGATAVLGAISRGKLREAAGRRQRSAMIMLLSVPASALRQTAIAGVLELFDAERQRDVGRAEATAYTAPRNASVPLAQ